MKTYAQVGLWILKAAVVLVVAFYAVSGAAALWFGSKLESRLKEISERGEPITVRDIGGGVEGPNAARLEAALKQVGAVKLSGKPSEALVDLSGRWEKVPNDEVWRDARTAIGLVDAPLDAMASALRGGEASVGLSATPWKEDSGLRLRDLRAAVRGLSGRAVARAHDGDREGAADDLEAAAMAAGAASPRGALIGALVKIACVSIACSGVRNSLEFTTFTDEEAARICRALEAAMPADLISQAMLYERACGHVMFSAMGEGKVLGSDLLGSDPSRSADIRKPAFLKKLRSLPYRAWIYAQEVVYLDAMTRNSELSHKRYRELAGNKLEEEINAGLPRWAMLTGALIPVFARSHAAADAGIARVEATKALLALTGYKAGHGAYPASLDEAQTGACRIGEDPFSGKPLVYRRQGEGFLLYSIGDDLKDDGGKPGGKADLVTTMAR